MADSIFDKSAAKAFGAGDAELERIVESIVPGKTVGELTKVDVIRLKRAFESLSNIEERIEPTLDALRQLTRD